MSGTPINYQLNFIVPAEKVLAEAQRLSEYADDDVRNVAKTLVDQTALVNQANAGLENKLQPEGTFDLAPLFDNWLGDSLERAEKLLTHSDESVGWVARCLIEQSEGLAQSKENFLTEMKRAT